MDYMIFLSWISAALSFLVFAAGFFIFLRDIKKCINIIFLLICFFSSILLILINLQNFISNKEHFLFIYNLLMFLTYIFLPLNIHFYLELAKSKKANIFKIFIIYIVTFIMYILSLIYKFPFSDFIRINNKHWDFIPADNIGFYIYFIYCFFSFFYCLMVLLRWRIKSLLKRIKKQAFILIISLIIFLINGTIAIILFLIFESDIFFPLALFVSIFIYLISIIFVLLRYNFLSIDNKKMLDEVLLNIEEFIFLLDTKLKIIQTNRVVKDFFFTDKSDEDNSYFNFINNDNNLNEIFNNIINGKSNKVNINISYKVKNEVIKTDSYISKIEDKYKDIVAILIISKENKDIEKFKQDYNITDREYEVIKFTIKGLSAKEIAYELKISTRTVETHYNNIYIKLKIKNKIELINLINQYL